MYARLRSDLKGLSIPVWSRKVKDYVYLDLRGFEVPISVLEYDLYEEFNALIEFKDEIYFVNTIDFELLTRDIIAV